MPRNTPPRRSTRGQADAAATPSSDKKRKQREESASESEGDEQQHAAAATSKPKPAKRTKASASVSRAQAFIEEQARERQRRAESKAADGGNVARPAAFKKPAATKKKPAATLSSQPSSAASSVASSTRSSPRKPASRAAAATSKKQAPAPAAASTKKQAPSQPPAPAAYKPEARTPPRAAAGERKKFPFQSPVKTSATKSEAPSQPVAHQQPRQGVQIPIVRQQHQPQPHAVPVAYQQQPQQRVQIPIVHQQRNNNLPTGSCEAAAAAASTTAAWELAEDHNYVAAPPARVIGRPPRQQQQQPQVQLMVSQWESISQQQQQLDVDADAKTKKKTAKPEDNDEQDVGYESGDSVPEVRAERLAAMRNIKQDEEERHFDQVLAQRFREEQTRADERVKEEQDEAAARARWWQHMPAIFTKILPFILVPFAIMMLLGWMTNSGILTSSSEANAPCFASTAADDSPSSNWSERCRLAAETNQLVPCPPAGVCVGGELVSCGFDPSHAAFFVPDAKGVACELSPQANDTVQAIYRRLQQVTVMHVCHERLPISPVHLDGKQNDTVLFDYFDFGRIADSNQASPDVEKPVVWASTLPWLEYAVRNEIVKQLVIEQGPDGKALIGLSPENLRSLPLPPKCIAQHAVVSTLDIAKNAMWFVLVRTWHLTWFVYDVFAGAFAQDPLTMSCFAGLMLAALAVWEYWRKARNMKQSSIDADRAWDATLEYLKVSPDWHKALILRDNVKHRLYPNDAGAQKRFVTVVWPKVVRRIEADERIGKRDMSEEGKIIAIWKWL